MSSSDHSSQSSLLQRQDSGDSDALLTSKRLYRLVVVREGGSRELATDGDVERLLHLLGSSDVGEWRSPAILYAPDSPTSARQLKQPGGPCDHCFTTGARLLAWPASLDKVLASSHRSHRSSAASLSRPSGAIPHRPRRRAQLPGSTRLPGARLKKQ